jgi:hypothetical protein
MCWSKLCPCRHNGTWDSMEPNNVLKKALGTNAALYGCPSAIKCANLENISTTVNTTDLPPTLGNPLINSIDMLLQTWDGTRNVLGMRSGGRKEIPFQSPASHLRPSLTSRQSTHSSLVLQNGMTPVDSETFIRPEAWRAST